jgi:signal transduction histidine kinase/DNA-binding response OmpR family regulator
MATNGGGLARYDDGRFTHFGEADGLPSPLIRSLYQDADGWLWIGTEGRGLVRADPVTWPRRAISERDTAGLGEITVSNAMIDRSVVSIRVTDGLFDDVIHTILEDDFGRLWMSTNRGIFWVLRDELISFAEGEIDRVRSTGYTERDGLRNREANGGTQPAAAKGMDGRLWFATQDGVAVVDPADITRSQRDTPVLVEEVVAGERIIRADVGGISLMAEERDLEVRYTGLSFLAPENVRFRYRLEPYQDEWVEAGPRRTAFFTGVPPGRYEFSVVASNEAGVWSEQAASVSLTIAPFFFETGLFRGLVLALLGLLGVGGHRWRILVHRQREQELTDLVDARTLKVREHRTQLEIQNRQLAEQSEQLAALDRSKSRFFANVSHELRAPLTLTIGPLEDLKGRLDTDGKDEDAADVDLALRNSRRLLRLVTQILDVARLEANALTPRIREADLTALLRSVGESFAPLAERRRVEYRLELPDAVVPVFFDVDLMEKVIVNLLSNALKFTPEGGSVRVSLTSEEAGREVLMTVRDSGRGISPEARQHVFERFYRAESADLSLQPGSGIGLSLAKELVELHGGCITLESEIGFGSTFQVALRSGSSHLDPTWIVDPVADAPAEAADRRPQSAERLMVVDGGAVVEGGHKAPAVTDDEADDDDGRRTVLLIDDNEEVRAYVRRNLAAEYHVVEAADGAEGLRLAGEHLPDLIISDLVMPEMDGAGLVRRLREDASLAFIPVILLTARADQDQRVALLDLGADDYVTKPFDAAELEARVENLIRSRLRLREAARREAILRPSAPEAESADEVFLDRVRRVIEENLEDEDFDVERLAAALGYGRSSLYRRLQELLEESPAEIILAMRLDRAGDLLRARAGTVGEIAYGVGFKSVSHFSRRFRQRFGVPPSRYAEVVAQPETGAPQPRTD